MANILSKLASTTKAKIAVFNAARKEKKALGLRNQRKNLDAKSESEKLDTLNFFNNEDIIRLLEDKGYNVTISPLYHVLYSLSIDVGNYAIINIEKFLSSGNILFIPTNFRDDIELLNSKKEIIMSLTPGTGNQEITLTKNSQVTGIRRSNKLKGEK